jgi:methylated-DNA-[protein]-cysteine S-methyltransferase
MNLAYQVWKSPVGVLKIVANETTLVAILWEKERQGRVPLSAATLQPRHPILKETVRQLREYFAGKRTEFELPLDPAGTAFQKRAWQALRRIPFGETRSYAEQAKRIGNPKACRAVGAANGRNPLSIVVPCHRVIGSDGSLTGFAGGESVKRHLLELERRVST